MIPREQVGEREVVRFAMSTFPGHQPQTDARRLRVLGIEIAEEAQRFVGVFLTIYDIVVKNNCCFHTTR